MPGSPASRTPSASRVEELRAGRGARPHAQRRAGRRSPAVRFSLVRRARVHPHRGEREARVAERVLQEAPRFSATSLNRCGGDRCRAEGARQPARDRRGVDRALGVPAGRGPRRSRSSRPRAPCRGVGRHGRPLAERRCHVVALDLVRDQHVAGAPTRNLGVAVVPEPPVAVELERHERRPAATFAQGLVTLRVNARYRNVSAPGCRPPTTRRGCWPWRLTPPASALRSQSPGAFSLPALPPLNAESSRSDRGLR